MQQVYKSKRKKSNDKISETIEMQTKEDIKFIRYTEIVFLATDNQLYEIEMGCTNIAISSMLMSMHH